MTIYNCNETTFTYFFIHAVLRIFHLNHSNGNPNWVVLESRTVHKFLLHVFTSDRRGKFSFKFTFFELRMNQNYAKIVERMVDLIWYWMSNISYFHPSILYISETTQPIWIFCIKEAVFLEMVLEIKRKNIPRIMWWNILSIYIESIVHK